MTQKFSDDQFEKVIGWHGTLVEAAAILDIPWRRCWNYVSGRPIKIRPWAKTAKLPRGMRAKMGKRFYTVTELLSLMLGDRLLTAGLPGKVVQTLLDRIFDTVREREGLDKLSLTILIVYVSDKDPLILTFGQNEGEEFVRSHSAANDAGAVAVVVSLGSMLLELYDRILCFIERREFVKPNAGEQVKRALTKYREEHLVNAQSGE